MTMRGADRAAALFWLAAFIGLPAAIAVHDAKPRLDARIAPGAPVVRPPTAPPPVEPLEVLGVDTVAARVINAGVPFSTLPNPAARPFLFAGGSDDLSRAVDCMAAAQLYEAGDDAEGERAVAQVVLNRLRHPAFPKTVCGVVFQGSERTTGCQFTFTCDGALARTPSSDAWDRARFIARQALSGTVYPKVGYATHYHTDWVVPYWSSSLDKIAAVGTHLFFRWTGWWGTPPAFHRVVTSGEPRITLIARLSPVHGARGTMPGLPTAVTGAQEMAARPAQAIGADALGKRFTGGRLIAIEPGKNAFIFSLDKGASPDAYPTLAMTFCAGRSRCRILAWSSPAQMPSGFPIDQARLASMSFSYIHDAETGLQRALWNCAQTPRPARNACMRLREPTAAEHPNLSPPDAARRKRYEEVTISRSPTTAPVATQP